MISCPTQQIQYQTATNIYQKAVACFRTALGGRQQYRRTLTRGQRRWTLPLATCRRDGLARINRAHARHRGKPGQCRLGSPIGHGEPYRRRIATMSSDFDRDLGATVVKLGNPIPDAMDFRMQYDPGIRARTGKAMCACPT